MDQPLFHAFRLPVDANATSRFEFGKPLFHSFTAVDFQSEPQIFCAVQDRNGMMFFGNQECILIYDGQNWETVPLPNRIVVEGLAIDSNQTIWVGGVVGQLIPQSGSYLFKSLADQVSASAKPLGIVRTVIAIGKNVYFMSAPIGRRLKSSANGSWSSLQSFEWPRSNEFSRPRSSKINR